MEMEMAKDPFLEARFYKTDPSFALSIGLQNVNAEFLNLEEYSGWGKKDCYQMKNEVRLGHKF